MEYSGQNNDNFRYRWSNYKDNIQKNVSGEDHKITDFLVFFQTTSYSGFINETEIRYIDKMDPSDLTRHENFWIDTLKTDHPKGIYNICPYN